MLPKFRAWYILAEQMITEITSISYIHHAIIGEDGDGDMLVPLKFYDERNGPEVLLMQSTGLFDKNGVEIFEGDVVRFEDAAYAAGDIDTFLNIGYVEFNQGMFYITNRVYVNMEDLLDGDTWDVEIIGNIYENPKLVEGGNG